MSEFKASTSAEEVLTLKSTLESLIKQLEPVRDLFRGEAHETLAKTLHDDVDLPDKELGSLAAVAINLLHETQQSLEPGHLLLADHFMGHTIIKCLVSAVDLNLTAILAQAEPGGLTIAELSEASGSSPDRLQPVLRILYNSNIFSFDADSKRFKNNRVSKLLHPDHWTQWHNWVTLYGTTFYDIARSIPQSLRKGETRAAAQINFNTPDDMFTYFKSQGWMEQLYRTLDGGAISQGPGIVADYPWSEVEDTTVLDVGGGGGGLIAALLRQYPKMKGGVFDLQQAIDHNVTLFHEPQGPFYDLRDRVPRENLIGGDFFKSIPAFEVYTMKWVLHDWKDDDSLKILRNIRSAIKPGPVSRLVVLESILSDGQMGRLSRFGHLNMAMMTDRGKERTEAEWRDLAAQAGWKVAGLYPLRRAWVWAIDLRP